MQYVSRPHHYIGNRRQENNGLGRIGVSGQISSITTTHLGWDARHWPIPFVDVHRATVAAALAPRSFPEAEHQPVVVILAVRRGVVLLATNPRRRGAAELWAQTVVAPLTPIGMKRGGSVKPACLVVGRPVGRWRSAGGVWPVGAAYLWGPPPVFKPVSGTMGPAGKW